MTKERFIHRRVLGTAGALLLAMTMAGCVATGSQPPEPLAPHLGPIATFGEPRIWDERARRGYRSRLRLSMSGIVLAQAVIRIDERGDGRLVGEVSYMRRDRSTGRALPDTLENRRFRVEREDWDTLVRAVEQARMFRLFPEFWVDSDPDALCIDGMILAFERGDAAGYRFSHANAQCTAPPAVREVARQMIEMSGERRLLGWLS